MLTLDDITFSYSKQGPPVLTDVTLQLSPGIHLLLGENGAGKTTLLHLMSALLKPQAGNACLDGQSIPERCPEVQRRIFFLPDTLEVPFSSIREMERCHAPFYPRFDASLLADNLSAFGISPDDKIKHMSLGTRRKAFIAYALSLRTGVLLLDEPANGLDIDSKKALRKMLGTSLSEDSIAVIATHTVQDLEALYDGVIILRKGHVQLSATTASISRALAFVSGPAPIEGAVYQESSAGLYKAIIPAAGLETAPDYPLLYSAMVTPSAEQIIKLLWQSHYEDR